MSRNFGPESTTAPGIPWKRLLTATLILLVWAAIIAFFAGSGGCTGKSIKLYSPTSGKPLAEYNNTTDSEIGGLEAEYDPTTGAFKVKVKSSAQSASASNEAAFAAIQSAIDKIPAP